ncbi:hypothetical protein Sjap_010027 [Stephania japonica]|uniref:Integrase catalytic domain-containing protein n=1 Tax=Stephania japonica TaxID=461633 RepID=A0AAP0JAE8_9MAGN
MRSKSEARSLMQNFVALIETQFNIKIKCFRSDQGKEFDMPNFYSEKGIIHQKSCVYTPKQNSKVESKHQHILNVARALSFQAKLPHSFWADCVAHVVHLINIVPSPIIHNRTPFKLLYNKPPNFTSLKVFGCLSFASSYPVSRNKLDQRARKCIFLGFGAGIKGYKLYDLNNYQIFFSRNVIFYEDIFPFPDHQTLPSVLPESSPQTTMASDLEPYEFVPFTETSHTPSVSPPPRRSD